MKVGKVIQILTVWFASNLVVLWILVVLFSGLWDLVTPKRILGRDSNSTLPTDLVYFSTDGGATTGFNAHFSLVPKGQGPKFANRFAVFDHVDQNSISCRWLSPEKLEVALRCRTEIEKHKTVRIPTSEISKNIQIVYKIEPSQEFTN